MTEGEDLAVFHKTGPLRGTARVPGDKSLSHRALILAGLAEGTSKVMGLSDGEDVVSTRRALEAFGVGFSGEQIAGGRDRFHEPERPLDVGNSGTALRLLSGVAASFPFLSVLVGDESIHRRPMDRIVAPLREMGAEIDGRDFGNLAPLCIRGGHLRGIDFTPSVPSAQVKGCILLAGLSAQGETVVREAVATRRHTEELLGLAGVPTTTSIERNVSVVRMQPGPLRSFHFDVPGDPSQAAFLVVAASIIAGSDITIERVYVGPGRVAFIDVLRRMGASIELKMKGNDVADLSVRSAPLHATAIAGSEVPSLIDEIPALAVAASFAKGTTTFRDASELRVKESDRIDALAAGLRAIGCDVESYPDGLDVRGGTHDASARVDAKGDHRVAMAFGVAGLAGAGDLEIEGFGSVATSWPRFREVFEALT